MNQMPFVRLPKPRPLDRSDLPLDLAQFYSQHEGVGRECDPDRSVRMHILREVVRTDWAGLELAADVAEGWEEFAAFHIGFGIYFEEIVYVLAAPVCPPGSILAVGGSQDAPLVLAVSLARWLSHLERWGWAEPAIAPAWELSDQEWTEVRRYYLSLNPELRGV